MVNMPSAERILIFAKNAEADVFIQKLRDGIAQRKRDYESNRVTPWAFGPADVEVHRLNAAGTMQFAQRHGSFPGSAQAYLFLSHGAVKACEELGLSIPSEKYPDQTIPQEATLVLKEEFRTQTPYAEIKKP